MLLLQIIGTLGAVFFILVTWGRPGVIQDPYQRQKAAWLKRHTDPLFGIPLESDGIRSYRFFDYSRSRPPDGKTPNAYKAPFGFTPSGFVVVNTDEFPLVDQKQIFEWMVEKMDDVSAAVTESLLQPRDWGVTEQEAAIAFRPDRITLIRFEGSRPVAWTIVFDTDIGQGESLVGVARGEDQNVTGADLDYG